MLERGRSARKRTKGKNRKYGELVKVAVQIAAESGRKVSPKTIYGVLKNRFKSSPTRQLIRAAQQRLQSARKVAA
jgi:hypothetical protein